MYNYHYGEVRKAKKRVFISFDYDNDKFLRDALVGQSKYSDSPFEISDWSVKEPWANSVWKEECRKKIRRCNLVLVMVGQKTYLCSGVIAEIKMAKEEGIPVVGIKGHSDKTCPLPEGLGKYYRWTWDNIKSLVHGNR